MHKPTQLIGIATVVLLAVSGCGDRDNRWRHQVKFDSVKWKAAKDPGERAQMVADLIGLVGLPRYVVLVMPYAHNAEFYTKIPESAPIYGKSLDETRSLLGPGHGEDGIIPGTIPSTVMSYRIGYFGDRAYVLGPGNQHSLIIEFVGDRLERVIIGK